MLTEITVTDSWRLGSCGEELQPSKEYMYVQQWNYKKKSPVIFGSRRMATWGHIVVYTWIQHTFLMHPHIIK